MHITGTKDLPLRSNIMCGVVGNFDGTDVCS